MSTGGDTSGVPTVSGTSRTLKLPTFSGGTEKDDLSPLDFVERIEAYCKATKRDANDECNEMHLALRGNATIWWRTLKRKGIDISKWKEVKKEFLETYAPTITGRTAHAIGQLEQKSNESVNDFFGRLDQIIDEMMTSYPDGTTKSAKAFEEARNHIQKYLFVGGLRETLRTDVLKVAPSNLIDAFKEACKSEVIHKRQNSSVFAIEDIQDNEAPDDLDEEEIAAINQRRFKMGKRPLTRRRFNAAEVKCYNCNKMGHISKNCTAPRKKPIRAISDDKTEDESNTGHEHPGVNAIQDDSLDFW
jgi:hypothetical protein